MKFRGIVMGHHPINVGAIVQGNYSEKCYRVENSGDSKGGGWWVQGRDPDNHHSCGWFNGLGKRDGNEIEILDDSRPDDKLLILSEPDPWEPDPVHPDQDEFDFAK